eukprot:g4433.t1
MQGVKVLVWVSAHEDGALVLLGLMVEYLVELDPTQMEEVEARRKRKGTQRKAQQSVSVEELISRYVRPAMTSPAAFLRLRGACCLESLLQREDDEVSSAEVGSALQRLVEAFPYEVVPFAAQLVSGLARQFCLSSSKDEEDDDADESESLS